MKKTSVSIRLNPYRNIPIKGVLSLLSIFLFLSSISHAETEMVQARMHFLIWEYSKTLPLEANIGNSEDMPYNGKLQIKGIQYHKKDDVTVFPKLFLKQGERYYPTNADYMQLQKAVEYKGLSQLELFVQKKVEGEDIYIPFVSTMLQPKHKRILCILFMKNHTSFRNARLLQVNYDAIPDGSLNALNLSNQDLMLEVDGLRQSVPSWKIQPYIFPESGLRRMQVRIVARNEKGDFRKIRSQTRTYSPQSMGLLVYYKPDSKAKRGNFLIFENVHFQ